MHATKETCILAFASMAGAGVLTLCWAWRRDGLAVGQALRPAVKAYGKHVAGAALVAAFVSVVFMSGFFTNARGPLDSVLTYTSYLGRAAAGADRVDGASFHDHPWYYYLKMLLYTKDAPGPWWSEALILMLAFVGAVIALARRTVDGANRHFVRFLTFYTILLIIAYSMIPYKTPWCALSFLHGTILLAGFGAVAIVRAMPHWTLRGVAAVLLAGATVQLGFQAYRASYVYCADTRNPYVYAHTAPDMLKLAKRMEDLAAIDPRGYAMPVYVMTPDADYWPLPWYLRHFDHVGYWDSIPDLSNARVVIAGAAFDEMLAAKLQDAYQPEYYGLRPEVLLAVYIEQDLWKAFIETRR
jgi:uncharacterized protein (TIGR03663 family)